MATRRTTGTRLFVLAITVAISGALGASPVLAASSPAPSRQAPAAAMEWLEGLTIEPSGWTTTPDVTLHLPALPDGATQIAITLDGSTWASVPWAETIAWSLIDPAAGGIDVDGHKNVYVRYGDGVEWTRVSVSSIGLDRDTPSDDEVAGIEIDARLWRAPVLGHDGQPVPDIAETRHSLDGGVTWSPWTAGNSVDIWNDPDAAAWYDGDHAIDVQLRDFAGNESDPIRRTAAVETPVFVARDDEYHLEGLTFSMPLPPITGRPYTIRITYPAGYTLPSNAWCRWTLLWGDDASINGAPNPTWGELMFERPKSTGACTEWTFTLPYRVARQFTWQVSIGTKNANTEPMEFASGIYDTSHALFRALNDGHDERFLSSNLPFAYVLPETTISQSGDPVTYRLHTVGTTTVPQSGMWWTHPLGCYLNPDWSQQGGNTFTYTPKCDGPWVTGWTGVMYQGYMRSQYDPLVDGRAPKVSAPAVKLRTGGYGSMAPGTVKWSGRDSGSGVYRYVLEVSRNGRLWQQLTLPSRLSTSISKSFGLSGTYRFRVRARDRVGNWSAWVYGPTVRGLVKEESSTLTRWSGAWSGVTGSTLSGGKAKATTSSAAVARITTTARSIAWVSRLGPDRGRAQVWVDGTLATTVDLGAPTLTGKTVVFARSWSSGGTHTLRIVPLGTEGRPLVEVDAFLVIR